MLGVGLQPTITIAIMFRVQDMITHTTEPLHVMSVIQLWLLHVLYWLHLVICRVLGVKGEDMGVVVEKEMWSKRPGTKGCG